MDEKIFRYGLWGVTMNPAKFKTEVEFRQWVEENGLDVEDVHDTWEALLDVQSLVRGNVR